MMAAESTVSAVTLRELLKGFTPASGEIPDIAVSGIQTDSRKLAPGDIFLACKGFSAHGLEFLQQALQRGAAAVVWEPVDDQALQAAVQQSPVPAVALAGLSHKLGIIAGRFYAGPSLDMHVIGVTGTDGKTSVTHFLAQAMSDGASACGLIGTLGYGVYGALQAPTHTTPDPLTLQAELAKMRAAGVRCVAMEVSSHALHQHRSDGVAFNTAVLTHLSRDHLDYHGDIEAYAEAKRRLFTMPGLETAVLNVGDDFGRQLTRCLQPDVSLIAYGRSQHHPDSYAQQWVSLLESTAKPAGIELKLATSWGDALLAAPLLGDFNADNLLAALGALLASGLPLDVAVERLARVRTVPGRMELFTRTGAPHIVVDYAHTPHALETVLQALRPHCHGDLICVFGAGGDRDPGKRPLMGAAAERYADRVVLTSDNPRSEPPQTILRQIAAGFAQPERAECIVDRREAIEQTVAAAAVDDLILVAGKGHEDYQQVGATRLAFSDRLCVQQALRRRVG